MYSSCPLEVVTSTMCPHQAGEIPSEMGDCKNHRRAVERAAVAPKVERTRSADSLTERDVTRTQRDITTLSGG